VHKSVNCNIDFDSGEWTETYSLRHNCGARIGFPELHYIHFIRTVKIRGKNNPEPDFQSALRVSFSVADFIIIVFKLQVRLCPKGIVI
jgi:hypothetical protein